MVSLSHLFYVDGAIFIGQWSELSIDTLVQVLECFYRASGLRINMCKSKIIGVNVEDGKIQNAASKLGCLVLKDSVYISWGQTCWTSIVKEARYLKGTCINVMDLIRLKLGNRDSSSFWEDKWYFWPLKSEGDYSVASIRKLIDEKRFQEVGISTRWVKSVPSKVNITAWKIKTNALPTRFNLSRRGMDIDTLMCPVCKGGVETTSHLFFNASCLNKLCVKSLHGGILIIRT
nr:RNA-directed DNA polymerase, eukaryota [Tanacetum cinerariifolium]